MGSETGRPAGQSRRHWPFALAGCTVHLADASAPRAIDTRRMPKTYRTKRDLVAAAQAREPGSRDALVEEFLPLIGSVARVYRSSPAVDRSELMQAGVLGLLRALERYDLDLGTPFWAYASWWVREAMQRLVSELGRALVLSDRASRELARIRAARRALLQCHAREPSYGDLADATGIPRDRVDHLIAAERRPRALEEPIGGDADAGPTLADRLADPSAEDHYDRVLSPLDTEALPSLLEELETRERWIVSQRFGLDGSPRTLRDLAGVLGVSAERVRQVEAAALDKLRAAVAVHA